MKSLKIIGLLLTLSLGLSCNKSDNSTQEKEAENLNQLFAEIKSMATSENCEDAADWTFTSYGSKACGGPVGFMAYSKNIDTESFLSKIEEHRTAQDEFNQKWGITSDCSIPAQPNGVACENGKAVLVY